MLSVSTLEALRNALYKLKTYLLTLKNVKQVLRRQAHDTFGHLVLLDYRPKIRSGRFYV